ncbi:MAG: serine hydrolase [Xanthomonadales bacterium]|nr:serine hydrolase [Xanthomonadales bacterium]
MTYIEFDNPAKRPCQYPGWHVFIRSLCLLLVLWVSVAGAQEREGISDVDVMALANRAMSEFNVPGMAIGIVKGEKTLLAQGYGVREIEKPEKIDSETLFKIASNSKAFTTAALAVLVDDGLISWDGLVIDYLPEFRMKDPWVTANFTVKDLLTHRSGLAPFVGDMLLWPEPNAFTVRDIIYALRFFEPVSSFRTKYAYDNQLYIVAGEIIPPVTGQSWGEFVESRIMRPAGMKHCFADRIPKRKMRNLATPHGVIEGRLSVIERSRIPSQPPISAAAGGVICSLEDMLTWVRTQLNRGTTPKGLELFSSTQSREMWKPQMLLNVRERDYELNRTHFKAYGLGWRLADVHGYKEVSHTGTLAGMKSYVVLIPELELGVVLLTNSSSSAARSSVMNTIVRSFMPVKQVDWIQMVLDETEAAQQTEQQELVEEALVETDMKSGNVPGLSLFTGLYRDPWFGDINIDLENGQLVFSAVKSPKFKGVMRHHDGNRFVVRWTDRTLEADAFVLFETERSGQVNGISMTKMDDGDYDFDDLNLKKVD